MACLRVYVGDIGHPDLFRSCWDSVVDQVRVLTHPVPRVGCCCVFPALCDQQAFTAKESEQLIPTILNPFMIQHGLEQVVQFACSQTWHLPADRQNMIQDDPFLESGIFPGLLLPVVGLLGIAKQITEPAYLSGMLLGKFGNCLAASFFNRSIPSSRLMTS